MRFMSPSITCRIAKSYAAPFLSPRSKAGVTRFARLVPGLPQVAYDIFEGSLGRLLDGTCDEASFSSLFYQSRLRNRDKDVRAYWKSGESRLKVEIAFGDRDPLLGDFYQILCDGIRTKLGKPEKCLLRGGGHYAVEEKPQEIVQALEVFIDR